MRTQRLRRRAQKGLGGLTAAAFGVLYFLLRTDVRILDPRRVDLVDTGDFAYHVVARNFAQWDAWHWPLTRIANYQWPVGTSSVYTDSNPWITLVAKLLLPADARPLQFVGLWLALCFGLQGYVGAKLCSLVTRDRLSSALGGCLFVLAPILLARLGHDTLCAHWILLYAMTAALSERCGKRESTRTMAVLAALLMFAAGLHPTLFAMTIPFVLIALIRQRPTSWGELVGVAACVGGPALVLVAFGTLRGSTQSEVPGFGAYSANLLALVDPQLPVRSAFLPVLPHEAMQYEGFGYLGFGALLALLIAIGLTCFERRFRLPRAFLGLAIGAAACAAYAASSRIFSGHRLVADISFLYAPFHSVTNAFRSSGRFIWPLTYALTLVAVAALASLGAPWNRIALVVICALQIVDSKQVVDVPKLLRVDGSLVSDSSKWALASSDYRQLILDPPDIESNGFKCPEARYVDRYFLPLAEIATRHHLSFNSGQAARLNEASLRAYCSRVVAIRLVGQFDPLAIYVPSAESLGAYRRNKTMICGVIDGYPVCVRKDRPTPLSTALSP